MGPVLCIFSFKVFPSSHNSLWMSWISTHSPIVVQGIYLWSAQHFSNTIRTRTQWNPKCFNDETMWICMRNVHETNFFDFSIVPTSQRANELKNQNSQGRTVSNRFKTFIWHRQFHFLFLFFFFAKDHTLWMFMLLWLYRIFLLFLWFCCFCHLFLDYYQGQWVQHWFIRYNCNIHRRSANFRFCSLILINRIKLYDKKNSVISIVYLLTLYECYQFEVRSTDDHLSQGWTWINSHYLLYSLILKLCAFVWFVNRQNAQSDECLKLSPSFKTAWTVNRTEKPDETRFPTKQYHQSFLD